MRCFLPCFGTSKRRKQLGSATATEGAQTHVGEGALEPAIVLTHQKTVIEELVDCIAEPKIKNEQQSNTGAEVTFAKEEQEKETEKKDDHEKDDVDVVNKRLHQEESSESLFSLSIECSGKQVSAAERTEIEVNSPMQLVCSRREVSEASGSNPISQEKPSEKEAKEESTEMLEEQPSCIAIRKEEEGPSAKGNEEDINVDESDLDVTCEDDDPQGEKIGEGEDVNRTWVQEESSESLFSLSTDSRKRISSAENAENEVNSLMPVHVKEVLNPIENLTLQERVVKATTVVQPMKIDKENINLEVQDVDIPISPETSLKVSNRKARQRFNDKKQEIGVDTSLSSWLVESETTPISKNSTNSPLSHEDRPILGALTVEDIRMYSISTSSRRSRSRSPDETPIIGTVGSYWSHTGQSMDSKFNRSGKDGKLKWSSTTLKTRLEHAFDASVSQV